jgi:hypothetical protein
MVRDGDSLLFQIAAPNFVELFTKVNCPQSSDAAGV